MAYKVFGDLVISTANLPDATTSTKGIVRLAGDLDGTASLPTVVKINGTSVPSAPSTNGILVATSSTTSVWSLIYDGYVASNAAIAGTKISPNFGSQNIVTLGSITGASIGVGTGTPPTITSGSGVPGTSVPDGSLYMRTDGDSSTGLYTRQGGSWSAISAGGGSFTAGGDLTGSSSSQQVVSLTGSAGILSMSTTAATLRWAAATLSPTLTQVDNTTNSATAETLLVKAQNATGTSSVGGNLKLRSGTGTSSDGYVNLEVGSSVIARAVGNKFVTSQGLRTSTTSITNTYTILVSDYFIAVGSLGAPKTITLPVSPIVGDTYIIKDTVGEAFTNNITISGNGNNIDGSSTYLIAANYATVGFVYTGTQWSVI